MNEDRGTQRKENVPHPLETTYPPSGSASSTTA